MLGRPLQVGRTVGGGKSFPAGGVTGRWRSRWDELRRWEVLPCGRRRREVVEVGRRMRSAGRRTSEAHCRRG